MRKLKRPQNPFKNSANTATARERDREKLRLGSALPKNYNWENFRPYV